VGAGIFLLSVPVEAEAGWLAKVVAMAGDGERDIDGGAGDGDLAKELNDTIGEGVTCERPLLPTGSDTSLRISSSSSSESKRQGKCVGANVRI
jgi:hypothetical protein